MSPLTFAIGDVHGCFDMLQSLLGACEAHAAGRPGRYVFLGDYIDRGSDSRGVIQLLMRRQQAQPAHTSVCAVITSKWRLGRTKARSPNPLPPSGGRLGLPIM
jgi:hypothetical protein